MKYPSEIGFSCSTNTELNSSIDTNHFILRSYIIILVSPKNLILLIGMLEAIKNENNVDCFEEQIELQLMEFILLVYSNIT